MSECTLIISRILPYFSGGGCRAHVVMKLRSRFQSPDIAKESYDRECACDFQSDGYSPLPIEKVEINPTVSCLSSASSLEIVKEDSLAECIAKLPHDEQLQLMSQWLTNYASEVYGLSIPSDFILLAKIVSMRVHAVLSLGRVEYRSQALFRR